MANAELNAGSIQGSVTAESSLLGVVSENSSIVGSVAPSTSAIKNHPELTGRDEPNQHPISSVTNLTSELNTRPSEVISDSFINLLN